MIKTFEQFVSERYGKPVNEALQSGKLREIIKQHGLPKNDWNKKMLYDLQDEEIVDVVNSRDEYKEKYPEYQGYERDEATFMIELEDGACLVIGNLGILKDYFKDRERHDLFKKRHSERHKGNLGKDGGDDIHKKHLEKVDELERNRFAASLQSNLDEIAKVIKDTMDAVDSSDLDEEGTKSFEFETSISGQNYTIEGEYEVEFSGGSKRYGAYYYDIVYNLLSFIIWDEDGGKYATNEDLGMTEDTYGDLFEPITIDDVTGEIYDYYAYYGVSRSDFY